jgi:hypothetical protein
MAAVDK